MKSPEQIADETISAKYHDPSSSDALADALADRVLSAHDVRSLISSAITTDRAQQQISTALNRAADEVLQIARDDGDELLRDAINLVVNAGLHFIENPDASLHEAIAANYDDPDEVLDQLQ